MSLAHAPEPGSAGAPAAGRQNRQADARPPEVPLAASILEDADRCVKCGLCLPHCPTYNLDATEAESPRGRITLLQALASHPEDAADPSVQRHLDHCLSCRACEAVCPAQVPYGRLFDHGQTLLARQQPARARHLRRQSLPLRLPRLRRLLLRGLWLLQRTGILALARHLLPPGWARRSLQTLPRLRWPRAAANGVARKHADLLLFTGCMAEAGDAGALAASLRLCDAAGLRPTIPNGQSCCGALQQHGGDAAGAAAALQKNAAAFDRAPSDGGAQSVPVVALASGCEAWLRDAARQGTPPAFTRQLASLWELLEPHELAFQPAAGQRVAVWVACTQRNVNGDDEAMLRMLRRVPETALTVLDRHAGCCGAAGLHGLREPQRADALAAPILDTLRELRPELLLCANVGCRMHLEAHLRAAGARTRVQHPAEWLAAHLP